MRKLEIRNTSFRNEKILLIQPDREKAEEIEARFEQDPQFVGLNFYTATTLEDARVLVKQHGIQTAIYPEGLDGRDFVTTQQELVHAAPGIKLIPLLDVPSITQLRESKRIGGVIDYGERKDLQNIEAIIQLVWGYLRDQKASNQNGTEILERTSSIQQALLIDHKDWSSIKKVSSALIGHVVSLYDLSPTEALNLVAAEQLYFPWIDEAGYTSLLKGAVQEFTETMNATASWRISDSKPRSVQGFIITLVNFLAEQIIKGIELDSIVESIGKRPSFLLHPAIRVTSGEKLKKILMNVAGNAEGSSELTG